MTLNSTKAIAAGLLAVATAVSSPAFAQTGGGGQGSGGSGSGGGHHFEGPVPGVSHAVIDPDRGIPQYYKYEPDSQFDCDTYQRRAHGPAAEYWQARFEYCLKNSKS